MKDKINVIIFMCFISIFSITHIILKDKIISETERRKLETFPKFQLNANYITEIEEYLLDHFPLRDTFRGIKANFNYNILKKLDNNNIYLKDNYIYKSNYPTNKKSIENFKQKTEKIYNMLNENNKVYMMIIPDKNYYLNDKDFLNIDYEYIFEEIKDLKFNYIDIKDLMNVSDYYETDTHWKQENLDKVVHRLGTYMGYNYKNHKYKKNEYDNFYGVYYGESAINRLPEKITYLTNDIINDAEVKYLENKNLNSVYNLHKLEGLDSYEVYLDGASSFIEITNKYNNENKELVIFRDSFGSSFAPLLIPYYSKITIIDNRYITSDIFKDYIKFENQDILFMYSTLLINDSSSLKG